MGLVKEACRTHGGECTAAYAAKTLPMAGAQFKQNQCEIVKLTIHCDGGGTVEYSERRIGVERYTFFHDSFLSTIVP
jgi:hypothetical protein